MFDISMIWYAIFIQSFVIGVLILLLLKYSRKLSDAQFKNRSQSTLYGKISEQFIPFMKTYPYTSKNFRFLGSPIDGVQFEEDKIVLIEFKSATSKLSKRQREIRELVNQHKIEFQEIRIN